MPIVQQACTTQRRRQTLVCFAWRHPFATAAVLAAVWVTALRLGWGWDVERRLAEQHRQIASRGEPVEWADVHVTPLPDEENAWTLYAQAVKVNSGSNPYGNGSIGWEELAIYPPFGEAWMRAAELSEKENGESFRLARAARRLSKLQLYGSYPRQVKQVWQLPIFPGSDRLHGTLQAGAILSQLHGDDREAIERLLDLMHMTSAMNQDHFVVSQSFSAHRLDIVSTTAQMFGPRLNAADPDTRTRMRQLFDRLLNESDVLANLDESLVLENALRETSMADEADGTWWLHPMGTHRQVRENFNIQLVREAARLGDAESIDVKLATFQSPFDEFWFATPDYPELKTTRYSRWYRGHLDRKYALDWLINMQAERRAAALNLAIQLYRADHHDWPKALIQLVPNYLASLPADPFHANHRPFGYEIRKGALPDGRDRPLLWFDAGPNTPVVDDEPTYNGDNIDAENRQYRDLAAWTPKHRRVDDAIAAAAAQAAAYSAATAPASPATLPAIGATQPSTVPTTRRSP